MGFQSLDNWGLGQIFEIPLRVESSAHIEVTRWSGLKTSFFPSICLFLQSLLVLMAPNESIRQTCEIFASVEKIQIPWLCINHPIPHERWLLVILFPIWGSWAPLIHSTEKGWLYAKRSAPDTSFNKCFFSSCFSRHSLISMANGRNRQEITQRLLLNVVVKNTRAPVDCLL